jgi:hypothetical protein
MKKWFLIGAVLWLLFSYIIADGDGGKIESNFTPQIVKDLKKKLQPQIAKVQKQLEKADRSVAQASEGNAEDFSTESYEKNRLKQILCFYRKNNIPFSDTPDSLYHADMMFRVKENSEEETQNYQLYIKSPDCQAPLYSRVDIQDHEGSVSVEKNIDCNRTTKEELFLAGGFQQAIEFIGDDNPQVKNLAISGDGFFILACNDNRLYATRKGNFHWNADGVLTSEDKCSLFGGVIENGKTVMRAINRGNIDSFQVLNLRASSLGGIAVVNKERVRIDLPGNSPQALDSLAYFPRESTTTQESSSIFENYLEAIDDANTDELGINKDMWQKEDQTITCSDADKYFRRIEQNDVTE